MVMNKIVVKRIRYGDFTFFRVENIIVIVNRLNNRCYMITPDTKRLCVHRHDIIKLVKIMKKLRRIDFINRDIELVKHCRGREFKSKYLIP